MVHCTEVMVVLVLLYRTIRGQASAILFAFNSAKKENSSLQLRFPGSVSRGSNSELSVCVVQDQHLKVQLEHAVVSHIAFRLPVPSDPAAYPELATPSGKPFRALPEELTERIKGGFLSLQAPADGAAPGMVYFVINCRDGGDEVNGLLTCRCEHTAPVMGTLVIVRVCGARNVQYAPDV